MDNWRPDSFVARKDHQTRIGRMRAENVIADIKNGRKPDSLTIPAFFGHKRNRPLPSEANPVHDGYNEVVRAYLAEHDFEIPSWAMQRENE